MTSDAHAPKALDVAPPKDRIRGEVVCRGISLVFSFGAVILGMLGLFLPAGFLETTEKVKCGIWSGCVDQDGSTCDFWHVQDDNPYPMPGNTKGHKLIWPTVFCYSAGVVLSVGGLAILFANMKFRSKSLTFYQNICNGLSLAFYVLLQISFLYEGSWDFSEWNLLFECQEIRFQDVQSPGFAHWGSILSLMMILLACSVGVGTGIMHQDTVAKIEAPDQEVNLYEMRNQLC